MEDNPNQNLKKQYDKYYLQSHGQDIGIYTNDKYEVIKNIKHIQKFK